MNVYYRLSIKNPQEHHLDVAINIKRKKSQNKIIFFMPSWSPGSYLMREYSRFVSRIKVEDGKGRPLWFEQISKGAWRIDFSKKPFVSSNLDITLSYRVYCHELTVRTSHIDESHAFLHGPSIFMGFRDVHLEKIPLEIKFPTLWSRITTGLKDISQNRTQFLYQAKDYDNLLDCPIEIGCHETDGFMVQKKEHHLAFYGEQYPHNKNLKKDIKTLVEYISKLLSDIPYKSYSFIVHFLPNLYGGLEHGNSCALQFDGRKLGNKIMYQHFLSLVAHEYFHTWNIKRIRPKEFSSFDYENENYTTMLWLAEGLTNYVDDLLVFKSGLMNLEDYLAMLTKKFQRYFLTPGRYEDSLEQSSFNAWIKLYRPHENSQNDSVSYYLKGSLVFCVVHLMLKQKQASLKNFISALWNSYKKNPKIGITTSDVLKILKNIGGQDVKENFYHMISTTEDIDFETIFFYTAGLEFEWENKKDSWLGWSLKEGVIQSILRDSPVYKAGLNAGDEILAINGLRIKKMELDDMSQILTQNKKYNFLISRLGRIEEISVLVGNYPRELKRIQIVDRKKALSAFDL